MGRDLIETSEVTSSSSVLDTVDRWREIRILRYSSIKGMGIGKFIKSNPFTIGGFDWQIYFYPGGKTLADSTHVALFVARAREEGEVRALFEVKLMDQSGKGNHVVDEGGPHSLEYGETFWGMRRLFERSALEQSDYLKDDSLLVLCHICVVRSQTLVLNTYSIPVSPSDLGLHIGQLLESGKGIDVNIDVNGEIFCAHKIILAARSPVFRAQLFGPMKDQNTQCIKIEDMEAPVFKALLHFIYWDKLPDMEEFTGLNQSGASTFMSQHLLAAADQYGLDRLRLLCESNLCEGIAIKTVATTLALAEQHLCFQLKSVCLNFVSMPENHRAVMQTEGYEYLKQSCPHVITELMKSSSKVMLLGGL